MSNSTRNWRSLGREKRQRIRHEVCERHGWKCYYCNRDFLRSIDDFLLLTMDHVVPTSEGGAHCDPNNMVPACTVCNETKGALMANSPREMRRIIADKKLERAGEYLAVMRLRRRVRFRRLMAALAGCLSWLVLWPGHPAS